MSLIDKIKKLLDEESASDTPADADTDVAKENEALKTKLAELEKAAAADDTDDVKENKELKAKIAKLEKTPTADDADKKTKADDADKTDNADDADKKTKADAAAAAAAKDNTPSQGDATNIGNALSRGGGIGESFI